MKRLSAIFFAIISAISMCLHAQTTVETIRPVTSSYTFSTGSASIADTYLSPLIYHGWNLGLAYSRMQAMAFNPDNWVMRLRISGEASRATNFVGNGKMWRGDINASWAMMRRWRQLPAGITAGIGGYTSLSGGAIYNPRNGNNPAAAKAAFNIGLSAYATRIFNIGHRRILARIECDTPLLGAFFSQQYGELYYEIWLGDRSGLVHCAWPGNFRSFNGTLSADIELGSTWLRLGYRSYIHSTHVCDITTRVITNSFIIGISSEWLSLKHAKALKPQTRVISALY